MGKRGIIYFIFLSILLAFGIHSLQIQENPVFSDTSGLQAFQQSLFEVGNLEDQDENLVLPSSSRFRKMGLCPNGVRIYYSGNHFLSTYLRNHSFDHSDKTLSRSALCIYRI